MIVLGSLLQIKTMVIPYPVATLVSAVFCHGEGPVHQGIGYEENYCRANIASSNVIGDKENVMLFVRP